MDLCQIILLYLNYSINYELDLYFILYFYFISLCHYLLTLIFIAIFAIFTKVTIKSFF